MGVLTHIQQRVRSGVGGFHGLKQQIRNRENLVHGLQLAPGLFWVLGLLGTSMVFIAGASIFTNFLSGQGLVFTLEHYRYFLNNPIYHEVMWTSFVIALEVTIVTFLLAYPAAYFLAFFDLKYENALLILILVPFWINVVIRTYAWRLILSRNGVIEYFLVDVLGVVNEIPGLLFSQSAIVVGLIHVFLPFMWIPIYTSLVGIDKSRVEAAKNLGATKLEAFYEVTLPQSLPGASAGVILVFVLSFGSFLVPQLLGGSRNVMIANYIATQFGTLQEWGFGSALSMVFIAIVLAVTVVFNHFVGLENLYGSGEGEEASTEDIAEKKSDGRSFGSWLVRFLPSRKLYSLRKRVTEILDISAKGTKRGFRWYTYLLFAFLYLPIVFVIILSFTSGDYARFPLDGVSLRWYEALLTNDQLIAALGNSLKVAIITAICSGTIGLMTAMGMVRGQFKSRWLSLNVLNTIIIAPIVVPWVVTGVAMLLLFNFLGIQGSFFSVVVGHILITVPFVTVVVSSQLYNFDRSTEEAAQNLGATELQTFFRITLPQIYQGVVAGMLFAFTLSFRHHTALVLPCDCLRDAPDVLRR
jgi:ABC-type spermidine/putrescine transport system permease subunit I